jgi:hypothetical protein
MNWLEKEIHVYLDENLPRSFKEKVSSSEARLLVTLIAKFIEDNPRFAIEIIEEDEAQSHDFLSELKKI